MKIAVVLGLAAIGAVAAAARRARAAAAVDRRTARSAHPSPEIHALIQREAIAQGVAPEIAMVFADLESSFNPGAYGDRDWAFRHPREWRATQARLPDNPAINDPSAWGSYGLFGLLSAYHVQPHEHPHALWNPTVNAQRGVAAVKHAIDTARGDVRAARLLYVGCGLDGRLCSTKYVAQTEKRLRAAARKWHVFPEQARGLDLRPQQPDSRTTRRSVRSASA